VEYLFAPAQIDQTIDAKAQQIAKKTAEAFEIVGLLAVELFLTREGDVLINEVAPRPHNSGHHTIRANVTSQYEQHWRAILNLPLGSTHAYGPSAMVNLLGEDGYQGPAVYEGMEKLLATEEVFPFLYWKATTKPFRKMGHITIMDKNIDALKEKVEFVKRNIKVISTKD
jgi:5-(carboxyamino)imidazole ribonucleotide synthase